MTESGAGDDILHFAQRLADAARTAILPHFRSTLAIDSKAGGRSFDPVTIADRAAESAIRALIEAEYPDHGIVGEEFGMVRPAARWQWLLDPIDGTRAFISGMPLWGTLIALCDRDEPVLGIMDQPFLRERYVGTRAESHVLTDRGAHRLRTRRGLVLGDAILFATDPAMFREDSEQAAFARVSAAAKLTRYGGDCYAYCMLAAGHIDLVIEADLKFYDVAALVPIIEAAGGIITDWEGRRAFTSGRVIAAGDPQVHRAALERLTAG